MDDCVGCLDQLLKRAPILQAAGYPLNSFAGRLLAPGERGNAMTCGNGFIEQMRTDKAGAARDCEL
jgi:hypothetical protein